MNNLSIGALELQRPDRRRAARARPGSWPGCTSARSVRSSGFSAAFPLLLKTQFPEVTANLAFLGALVGSVARPLGGKLADRIGGAKVTFWNFVAMTLRDHRCCSGRSRSKASACS